jgi:hypothetical protein
MQEAERRSDWPGEDPAAIALAARIVMLSAASRTCILDTCSAEQQQLLSLLQMTTDIRLVRGRSFPEFLAAAQRHLGADAANYGLETVADTLEDIAASEPVDLVGDLYRSLVELASEVYEQPLGQRLNPTLCRTVRATGPHQREIAVRGAARRRSNEVELLVFLSGFDLAALALVPRILAHELICHIGARHTGDWADTPEPDVRAYFSDGFMDRAAWRLLTTWLDAGAIPNSTPLGQLTDKELEYSARRPLAFKAGMRAFDNCLSKTTEQVKRRLAQGPTSWAQVASLSEDASIRAAVRLNACGSHIVNKDWFVHFARGEERKKAASFALVAAADVDPSPLLEDGASS